MKTLLTSVALVATIATGASANNWPDTLGGSLVWNGEPITAEATCTFTANTAGVMSYTETNAGTGKWTTSQDAVVTVKLARTASTTDYPKNIKVEPASWNGIKFVVADATNHAHLHNGNSQTPAGTASVLKTVGITAQTNPTETFDVAVDYSSSTVTMSGGATTNANVNVNTNAVQAENFSNGRGSVTFNIGGTATHDDLRPNLAPNTTYQVSHIVTCLK